MICCALAGLLIAAAAAWHSIVKNIWLQQTRWIVGLLIAALLLVGGSALAAHRHDHTTDDLAAMLMRHVCGQHPVSQPSVD